jgi:hypothetical protein
VVVVVVDHLIPLPQHLLLGKISIFDKSFFQYFFSLVHLDHLVHVLIQLPHPVDPGNIQLLISHRSYA